MSSHVHITDDMSAVIQACADYTSQAVLGIYFAKAYEVRDVAEALDAAEGVENALSEANLVILARLDWDKLEKIRDTTKLILKLRKDGVPARDTKWKIAWRDLEELTAR